MMSSVSLRCSCGEVQGRCSLDGPGFVQRVLCHCDDCQAFVRWLKRPDVVDEHGGTDIVQVTPSQVRLDRGAAHLRSMRLSERGLLRWYTACCRTPVGNTLATPQVPFVGIPLAFVDGEVGPPQWRIQGKFSPSGCPEGVHPSAPPRIMARNLRLLLVARLRGRHRPTPFFDDRGAPVAAPDIVSART